MPSFSSLGLSAQSLAAVERVGYLHPTPIHARAIPPALAGSDVIGCAATGTGKTAAFLLPALERISGKDGVRALVVVPTRELALQIAEQVGRFGTPGKLRLVTLIGGMDREDQALALRMRPPLLIATPGRLLDHLDQGGLDLGTVEVLVLDEVDRILDLGFAPQLNRILRRLPPTRQTLLFSATMGTEVETFAKKHLREPVRVEVTPSGTPAPRVAQCVYELAVLEKTPLLLALLAEDAASTLVFVRTKRRVDRVVQALVAANITVESLHSDRSQGQRRHALEGFRRGKYRVLVATDIAARGVDVADIGHVVNYDLPHQPEDYVHRVGRTARAEASGRASSFVAPDDAPLLAAIEEVTRSAIPRAKLPRGSKVFDQLLRAAKAKQADPGPPQAGHGVSGRDPSKPLGRHALSHAKKKRD